MKKRTVNQYSSVANQIKQQEFESFETTRGREFDYHVYGADFILDSIVDSATHRMVTCVDGSDVDS